MPASCSRLRTSWLHFRSRSQINTCVGSRYAPRRAEIDEDRHGRLEDFVFDFSEVRLIAMTSGYRLVSRVEQFDVRDRGKLGAEQRTDDVFELFGRDYAVPAGIVVPDQPQDERRVGDLLDDEVGAVGPEPLAQSFENPLDAFACSHRSATVRSRATESMISSARSRNSASGMAAIGWRTLTNSKSLRPNASAWAAPEFTKTSVWIATVGMPRASRSTASLTHADVHEPQAPTPVTTKS